MKTLYDTKMVTAGHYREVRKYPYKRTHTSTLALRGSDRSATPVNKEEKKEKKPRKATNTTKVARTDSVKRTKDKVKYLIHANTANATPIFVTLTYRENMEDRSKAVKDIGRFLRSLRVLYPALQYLYVFEKQRRGAYHAHIILFNVSFIHIQTLENIWAFGYTNVRRLHDATHISHYLGKYITKESCDAVRVRRYSRSKNLTSEQIEYGLNMLTNMHEWSLTKERTYHTIDGTYTITTYKYGTSG